MEAIKADLVSPFVTSISNVLSTMANITCQVQKPKLKKSKKAMGDITGTILVKGGDLQCFLAISFPGPVICDITTKMLGETIDSVDETVNDMVGELTNMVSGGSKKLLEEKGYDFDMAIPKVIIGSDIVIDHPNPKANVALIPFKTETGKFFIEVSISTFSE